MPIYEYHCHQCHHEFEELRRSMADQDPSTCPQCGADDVGRKMSVFATRESQTKPSMVPGGGCGRCGDPSGPCGN